MGTQWRRGERGTGMGGGIRETGGREGAGRMEERGGKGG